MQEARKYKIREGKARMTRQENTLTQNEKAIKEMSDILKYILNQYKVITNTNKPL
jgi:hypothetical protein